MEEPFMVDYVAKSTIVKKDAIMIHVIYYFINAMYTFRYTILFYLQDILYY